MLTLNSNNINDIMTEPQDKQSSLGRFCWVKLGSVCIPCLLRKNGKYVPVRIAESKVLHNFIQNFNAEMYSCITVKSYGITKTESILLNSINHDHCNSAFGNEDFRKDRDLVVKLDDLKEYHQFLELCYSKLIYSSVKNNENRRCGFIKINRDSVVPYIIKDNMKYLPLFYFVGEIDDLENDAILIKNWDLAYLKFCCKVHGINTELVSNDYCQVTTLDKIKFYFPEETTFEDYWPASIVYTAPSLNHINKLYNWIEMPQDLKINSQSSISIPIYSTINNTVLSSNINETNTIINDPFSLNGAMYDYRNYSNIQNANIPPINTKCSVELQEIPQISAINLSRQRSTIQSLNSCSNPGNAFHLQYPNTIASSLPPTYVCSTTNNQTIGKQKQFHEILSFGLNKFANQNSVQNQTSRTSTNHNTKNFQLQNNILGQQRKFDLNQNGIIDLSSPPSSPQRSTCNISSNIFHELIVISEIYILCNFYF